MNDAFSAVPYCCSEKKASSSLTVPATWVSPSTVECIAPMMPLRSKELGRSPQIDSAFPIFLGPTDDIFFDSLLTFMYEPDFMATRVTPQRGMIEGGTSVEIESTATWLSGFP